MAISWGKGGSQTLILCIVAVLEKAVFPHVNFEIVRRPDAAVVSQLSLQSRPTCRSICNNSTP